MKSRKSKGVITAVYDGAAVAYYLNNKKIAAGASDELEDLMDALGYEFATIAEGEWEDEGDGFPDKLDDIKTID